MARQSREINVFGVSFLDVLANTIGGLAFLLIMTALMVGAVVFAPPSITTEVLPDAYDGQAYQSWLAAREGLGRFRWSFGEGRPPPGLVLDADTGRLAGTPKLTAVDGSAKRFEFEVVCTARAENTQDQASADTRRFALVVHRQRPVDAVPLEITTDSPLPAAYRGQPYPLRFAVVGGQPPYTWSASGPLPQRLTLGSQGRLSGEPAELGEFAFDVMVETARGERQAKRFALTVSEKYPLPPPVPPILVLTWRVPAASAENEYHVRLAAQGGKPPYTWRVVSGAPGWLRATPDAEAFEGTPAIADIGESQVVWEVSDAESRTARSEAITLKVLPPPGKKPPPLKLRTTAAPDARVAQPYALAIAADGGVPPYTWAASGSAVPGLRFSSLDGSFGGTPERVGAYNLAVTVTDSSGQRVSGQWPLAVRPAIRPVAILGRSPPPARVGRPYELALAATGGHPPYRWTLEGALPPGLVFDEATGLISGTPTEVGSFETRATVADGESQTAPEPLDLPMEVLTPEGFRLLTITTRRLPALLTSRETEIALAAEGGATPYRWSLAGDVPPGLAAEDGRIVGTPTRAGTYRMTLGLADGAGQTASVEMDVVVERMVSLVWLLVLAALLAAAIAAIVIIQAIRRHRERARAAPLQILTKVLPNARASSYYAVQLAAQGGVAPYRWRVKAGELPMGMTLSPEGLLSGKPFEGVAVDVTKDVPFTVEVEDHVGNKAEQSL